MSRHRGMRVLLDDINDAEEDYEYEHSDYSDDAHDQEYVYRRAEPGTEIQLNTPSNLPGPNPPPTPPSPSLTASASLATGLSQLSNIPVIGDFVSARYTADEQWYPAQVTDVIPLGDGHSLFRVMYKGYGNEEDLTLEHIRFPKNIKAKATLKPKVKKSLPKLKSETKSKVTRSSKKPPKSPGNDSLTKSRSVPGKLSDTRFERKTPKKKLVLNRTPPSAKHEGHRAQLLSVREQDAKNEKPSLNLVVIGHVDAGKSTMMGHMLVKLGEIDRRTIRKYQKESQIIGKGSFAFAWVLDGHEEERTRGITVDVGVTHFSTKMRKVTLLDAPGHRDFIPNMISGASQADAAILVVPAKTGEFEASFAKGGQTKEHAILIRSLGVKDVILAINKMDLVEWDPKRYQEIKRVVSGYLRKLGYKNSSIHAVPVSGLLGENLVESKSPDLKKWYKGPTLAGAIDLIKPPAPPIDKPLCMVCTDVFKSTTGGLTIAGKVLSGSIIPKDRVLILPANSVISVKSITCQGRSMNVAKAGDSIELGIKDVEDENTLSVGQLLCPPHLPLSFVSIFTAKILTLDVNVPLLTGQNVVIYSLGTGNPAFIQELTAELDRKTGEVIKRKPRCLSRSSAGELIIRTRQPICVERFQKNPILGRICIRRGGETVGFGIVVKTD